MFNVDLLHPKESTMPRGESLFVDHLELPMPESEFIRQHHFVRSIALPSAQFIFDFDRIAQKSIRCRFVDGQEAEVTVPLADEAAILVTKSESMRGNKRPRDPLDIYLAIAFCRDRSETASFFRNVLKKERPEIYNTVLEDRICRAAQSEPRQGSVPFHLTFANDLQLLMPVQVGFHLVLRRPIETTRLIGHLDYFRGARQLPNACHTSTA